MPYALCGLAAILIWGTSPIVMKLLVGSLPGAAASTAIFSIAACLTFPWLYAAVRQGGVTRATWVRVIIIGIMLTSAFNLSMALAASSIRGTTIGAIVALEPLMVALIATAITRRRPDATTVVALLSSFAGVWLLIDPSGTTDSRAHDAPWAVALVVLGAVLWCSAMVFASRVSTGWAPLRTSMVMICCGSMPFLLAVPLLPWWPSATWSVNVGVSLLFMALGVTVLANVLWLRAIRALGPTATGLLINLSPLTTVGLAVVWLGEPWTGRQLTGAMLILAALLLHPLLQAIGRFGLQKRPQ